MQMVESAAAVAEWEGQKDWRRAHPLFGEAPVHALLFEEMLQLADG